VTRVGVVFRRLEGSIMKSVFALVAFSTLVAGCATQGLSGEPPQLDFAIARHDDGASLDRLAWDRYVAPPPPVAASGLRVREMRVVSDRVSMKAAPTGMLVAAAMDRGKLAAGRVLRCWSEGNLETGYRILAQVAESDGTLGDPIALTSGEMDVVGSPHVEIVAGTTATLTFFVSRDDRFALVAASVEAL